MLDTSISKAFDRFLVQLHDTQQVLGLAKEKTPEAIEQLSNVIIEALGCSLSIQEAEMAADILIDLAKKLETHIRAGLALRLSSLKEMPLRLALHLANDDIAVAEGFLENSPALSDMDLYYIVQGKGREHWAAIAKRKTLSPDLITLLVEKKSVRTNRNLLINTYITIQPKALEMLKEFVTGHTDLMKEFVARQEVCEKMAIDLYWRVNEDVRAIIIEHSALDTSVFDQQMQDTATDFVNVVFGDLTITPEMQDTALRMQERGMLNVQKLVRALKSGQIGLFYAMFSLYADVPLHILDDIFIKDKGKALAIVARSLDIDRSIFVSFLVQTRKLRKAQKVDHNQLYQAINYFNNITIDAARSLLPQIIQQA